jgi:dTDP-glucose 4,6-dehydratase/UDP-glucose 4-epimerase
VDEKHPVRPVDVNGINKLAGEGYHLLYSSVYGIRSSVLRLTNTYGPGMRVKDARQTFLGIWIRQLLEGAPIKVFGDGAQLRDFNYVDDCVEALLRAASDDVAIGRVYNLGSAEVVSLKDLAQMMTALVPGARHELVPFPPERKAIDIGDYYSDFSLIRRDLGWAPSVGLREGLARSLDYFKTHAAHYWEPAA